MLGSFQDIVNLIGNTKKIDLLPKYKFFVDLGSVTTSIISKIGAYVSEYNQENDGAATSALTNMVNFDLKFASLLLAVNGVNTPDMVVDANEALTYPKINTAKNLKINGDLGISFFAESTNLVHQFYYNWLACIFNLSNGTSRPKFYYEVDMPVYIYNKIDENIEYRLYHNCSPRGITSSSYDSKSYGLQDDIKINFNINNNMTFQII
jgi:hypothetical protein